MGLLILLWVVWCGLHSLLITTTVRLWFERRGGAWLALYRLGYVAFSLGSLLPLLWYADTLPRQQVVEPAPWLHLIQSLLFLYALLMFIGGLRVYDLRFFLGLRQWREFRSGQAGAPPAFVRTGILHFVRHPWYSGALALLWALPDLTDVSLVSRIILSAYLLIGTLLEERKLKAVLGEPYLRYCREVPMLLPWKFGR